jgi:hypothetical protein
MVILTPTPSAPDDPSWGVLDWTEQFAAWEVVANTTATLVATLLGVLAAVAIERCRSRQRERQGAIRRGLALADEAERYPYVGPIEDVSVMAVAFPLWLAKDQIASDLNDATPALGSWVLRRLYWLHAPGSERLSQAEAREIADEVRGALRDEMKRRRSGRPTGWYSIVLQREQDEFVAQMVAHQRRMREAIRVRTSANPTARVAPKRGRRLRLSRAFLGLFARRKKD